MVLPNNRPHIIFIAGRSIWPYPDSVRTIRDIVSTVFEDLNGTRYLIHPQTRLQLRYRDNKGVAKLKPIFTSMQELWSRYRYKERWHVDELGLHISRFESQNMSPSSEIVSCAIYR